MRRRYRRIGGLILHITMVLISIPVIAVVAHDALARWGVLAPERESVSRIRRDQA